MKGLKALRKQNGLTQNDLAEKLNIDKSTVCKWETGQSMPRSDKLPELANIFNCTIDEILEHDMEE